MIYDRFLNYICCCEYKFSFFTNDWDSSNRTISVTHFILRIMLATSNKLILNSFMIIKNNFKQRKIFTNSYFETDLFSSNIKIVSWTEPTKLSIIIIIIIIISSSSILSRIEIIDILDIFRSTYLIISGKNASTSPNPTNF